MDESINLKIYKDLNLQSQRIKDENELRKNQEYVDVTIKGKDGTEFKVHKIVLASGCPYFKALFDSGMKESNQKTIQLDRDICGEDLNKLLEYIYTGEIQLSPEKAKLFCEYALYFQLITLKDYCADVLNKCLNLSNCLKLWEHAVQFLNDALIKFCLHFIIEKRELITQTNIFKLTIEQYNAIIEDINLSDIEKLYLFISRWIKAQYKERKIFVNGVINYFNFTLLSNNFVIKIIFQDDILLEHKEFTKKICEINENRLQISSNDDSSLVVLPEKFNYLVSMKDIYKMDANAKIEKVPNGKTYIGFQAHIYDYNTLFLSGGTGNATCNYFCPSTQQLGIFPPMKYGRHNHNVISLNETIYVMGGCSNKTVEKFNFTCEEWIFGPQLKDKTESIGLTTWNNSIYLFGSFDKYKCSTIVERYDPNEDKFTAVCQAPPIRSTKAVRIDDIVYCFNWEGGYKFNLRTNKWFEKIPKAPCQWTSIESVLVYKDDIKVLGIYNNKSVLCNLHPLSNTWSTDDTFLCDVDILQIV